MDMPILTSKKLLAAAVGVATMTVGGSACSGRRLTGNLMPPPPFCTDASASGYCEPCPDGTVYSSADDWRVPIVGDAGPDGSASDGGSLEDGGAGDAG